HFANAVMIPGIELGKPDVSFLVHGNAVDIGDFGEESEFLGLDIELAERAARTPDISLQVRDGGMPARGPGLLSRGVPQIGPRRVWFHLHGWRAIVRLAVHLKLFRMRVESRERILPFNGEPDGTIRRGQNFMNEGARGVRQSPRMEFAGRRIELR